MVNEQTPHDPWSDEELDDLLSAAARARPAAVSGPAMAGDARLRELARATPEQRRAALRPARSPRALLGLGALAAAAALLVMQLRAPAPLDYEVGAVLGSVAEARGVAQEQASFEADTHTVLTIRLRPLQRRAAPPVAVLTRCGSRTQRATAEVEANAQGGISVRGSAQAWFGAARGACEVWLGLGEGAERRVAPPAAAGASQDGTQWLMVNVRYLGEIVHED